MDWPLGRNFVDFRIQTTGENIYRFSRTSYWGIHLDIFDERPMGKTFVGFLGQALGEYF